MTFDEPPDPGVGEMRYLDAYRHIFQQPNWLNNVLLVGVCMIAGSVIPVVPHIIVMGYQFEMIEALHRRPRSNYPDFDFNRISQYLTRGIWPFLVILVASLVLAPIGFAIMVGLGAIVVSMLNAGADGVMVALVGALAILLLLAVNVLLGLVLMPMSLKSGLAEDFAAGFDFAFIKDFISRVAIELVLMWLFLTATSLLLTLLGLLACGVGALFTTAILMLAQAQLTWQLYELYLSRGGEPIVRKPHES